MHDGGLMHVTAGKLAALVGAWAVAAIAQVGAAGGEVTTYIGLGAQLSAVGGLVYVVRAMLTGDLVAKKTDQLIEMQAGHLEAIERLTENYQGLLEAVKANEQHLLDLLEHPRPRPRQ